MKATIRCWFPFLSELLVLYDHLNHISSLRGGKRSNYRMFVPKWSTVGPQNLSFFLSNWSINIDSLGGFWVGPFWVSSSQDVSTTAFSFQKQFRWYLSHTKRAATSVSDSWITVQSHAQVPTWAFALKAGFVSCSQTRSVQISINCGDLCLLPVPYLTTLPCWRETWRFTEARRSHLSPCWNRFLHAPVQPKWTIFKDHLVIYVLVKQVNISNEMVMIFLHVLNHKHGLFGRCIWFVNSLICFCSLMDAGRDGHIRCSPVEF